MAALHEVRTKSCLTWRGRRNIRLINNKPLRPGEQVTIDVTERPWPLDSYVVKAALGGNKVVVEVVRYQVSPDDLDPISRWSVSVSNVNSDPLLRSHLFYGDRT